MSLGPRTLLAAGAAADGVTAPHVGTPVDARGSMRARVLAIMSVGLMVASEFKLRHRDVFQSVGGSADLFVLAEVGVYLLAAAVLLAWYPCRGGAGVRSGPALWGGLFIAVVVLSAAISPFPALAVVRGTQMLVWGMAVAYLARLGGRRAVHVLAHTFIGVTLAGIVIGLVAPQPPLPLQQGRFTWLYVHPLIAATYLGLSSLLLLGYLFAAHAPRPGPRWPRGVYFLLLLAHLVFLVATRGRGAFVAVVLASIVLLASVVRHGRRADLVIGAVVVSAVTAFTLWDRILGFMVRGEDAAKLASLNSRVDLWAIAFEKIGQRPIEGHGLAASRGLFLERIGLGGAHNAYLNLLVDQGLVGMLVFIGLVMALGMELRRLSRAAPVGEWVLDLGLIRALLAFLLLSGLTTEYVAVPATVASGWLLLLVGWSYTLAAEGAVRDALP